MGSSWSHDMGAMCCGRQREEPVPDSPETKKWEEIAKAEAERCAKAEGELQTLQRELAELRAAPAATTATTGTLATVTTAEVAAQTRSSLSFEEEAHGMCSVCWEMHPMLAAVPCGHQCICKWCAKKVPNCPVCRQKVELYLPIFVGEPAPFQAEYEAAMKTLVETQFKKNLLKQELARHKAPMARTKKPSPPPPPRAKDRTPRKDPSFLSPPPPPRGKDHAPRKGSSLLFPQSGRLTIIMSDDESPVPAGPVRGDHSHSANTMSEGSQCSQGSQGSQGSQSTSAAAEPAAPEGEDPVL